MATHLLLLRHGAHDELGRALSGRSEIGLNAEGLRQAEAAARRLAGDPVAAVLASPRRRAQETARPVAERHGLSVEVAPGLDEVDFGAWAGRPFADLADDPHWTRWNAVRSCARVPGGESMAEVQARIVGMVEAIVAAKPAGSVVLVGHAEPLRALVLYHLGLGLDAWSRIELAPGSLTRLEIGGHGPRFLAIGEVPS